MQERAVPWWRELTRYQWTVLLVAWFGWVSDVYDTSLFFLAKGSIFVEFLGKDGYARQGTVIEGAVMTVFVLGWAVGGLVFGVLADRWGRTRTMMLTIGLYCAFTGLTFFARTWQEVAALRFLTALGIGGEWAAGTALVAEALPDRTRAAAAGFLQTAAAFGPILASLTVFALGGQSWRWLFVVGIAPALILLWIRRSVKEPERWVQTHARRGRVWYADVVELFVDPKLRRNTLVALTVGVVAIIAAGNLSYWLPNLSNAVSAGMTQVQQRQRAGLAQMIMHIGTLAGVAVFPWLCERYGRKKSLALFFSICPFVVAGVAWTLRGYALLVCLAPIMSFFVLGLTAGLPLYFPELFPTRLRGTGLGLCYNTGRVLQAPWPLLTGLLGTHMRIGFAVGLTSLVSFVGAAVMPFAAETKGRPLPDD